MKIVITIIQNKRVALPYLFSKYCLKAYPNAVLYHVHHDYDGNNKEWQSTRNLNESNLKLVHEFIDSGKYPDATIISHQEVFADCIMLPSFLKAAEIAIVEQADYHLWMEDDAIIYDPDGWKFKEEVGLYRATFRKQMINCAYFVSKPSFDEKLIVLLKNYKKDGQDYRDKGSQFEHTFWQAAKSFCNLKPDCAVRVHPYQPINTVDDVKNWLIKKFPEIKEDDLKLLGLDF